MIVDATNRGLRFMVMAAALALAGCPSNELPPPVSPTNHTWFPISTGATHEVGKVGADGVAISCEGCHRPSAGTFKAVRCDTCHRHPQEVTPRLHLGLPASFNVNTGTETDPEVLADLRGASCYSCHPTGEPRAFSHTLITDNCAQCHVEGAPFAALPKAGFTHRDVGSADCGGCHVTSSWTLINAAPPNVFDPQRNQLIDSLQPTWVATTIASVAPNPQSLPMRMNHATTAIDAGVLSVCSNCHAQADQGQYYPGVLHWSLINLGEPAPTKCNDCHAGASPTDFVGSALDTRRVPQTGEMKHDAVVWANGLPTATGVVTQDCGVCHQAPTDLIDATWATAIGRDDGGITTLHGSLTEAGQAQPGVCLDCHANTRPAGIVTSGTFSFDHANALGDCLSCHQSTAQWSGGKFHLASSPTPTTCLPCHTSDRPTTTTGWVSAYTASPFDYVSNVNNVTHGADQDCVNCHTGPGTGLWGTTQNWQSAHFGHGATTIAGSTCIACHTTQRPDLLTPAVSAVTVGFDHVLNGTGDCAGCHQASMTRGTFVNLLPIPGADWRGGTTYPGGVLISTPLVSVRVPSTTLTRASGLVTGMITTTVTLPNAFLHTSTSIPSQVAPGPAASPNSASCWHCHTSSNGVVSAYAGGVFHSALTNYRANPDAGITALAQPTVCGDCHAGMRPPGIVSRVDAGTWLLPMDHSAALSTGSVTAMDCGVCHQNPGLASATQWRDGQFHPKLAVGVTPSECISCHYPVTTTALADVTTPDAGLPSRFTMKHRSALVSLQACATCHTTALSRATTTPLSPQSWKTGAYHTSLGATPQPTTCTDCHGTADPTGATQGTTTYTLIQGSTATNGGQWMNHTHTSVTGKDCATCHLSDAKVSGAAWNHATALHSKVTGLTTCATCHGLTNGKGTVVGTSNNMPTGLNDTATVTTSSASPGLKDQIAHTDLNVTNHDCNFCHTQVGPSTTAGVQGKEWAQAGFHRKFSTASPLITNGTTARCSNCHLNVKPGTAYTQQDHSAFTANSAQDCSSCHSWPGNNPTTPNWLGATGAHASSGPTATSALDCNTCHGLNGTSVKHLAVAAASHYGGITNGNSCTACHINFTGFKDVVTNLKYGHTNATANAGGCVTCHAFKTSLYTTLTNTPALTHPTATGGHQFSQTLSVTGSSGGQSFNANHTNANLTRCGACHQYAATTATTNVWTFKHRPSNPGISNSKSTSGCNMCH